MRSIASILSSKRLKKSFSNAVDARMSATCAARRIASSIYVGSLSSAVHASTLKTNVGDKDCRASSTFLRDALLWGEGVRVWLELRP